MIKIRTCAICKKKDKKENLIRIVNINGKPTIDEKQKANKRAMYLCNNVNCFKNIINQINKGKFNNKLNFDNIEDFKCMINDLLLKM